MKKALIAAAVAVLGISCFSQDLNPGDILFQPQMNIVQNSFAEGIPLGYVFYSDGTESISRKKMDDVLQAAPGNERLVRRAKLWSCMEWLSFAGGMIFSDAADSSSGHFSDSLRAAGNACFQLSEICPAEASYCRSRAIDNYNLYASGFVCSE